MHVRQEKPGMITLDLNAEIVNEMGLNLTAFGLTLTYAKLKVQGATKEKFLEMCGELWDDWERLE